MSLSDERDAIDRARTARVAAQEVDGFLDHGARESEIKVVLPGVAGDRAVVVPREALELLVQVLEAIGDGQEPSVMPTGKELSTGEVASLLGVSRQYVVRLLDDGRLQFRRVGNRRRVRLGDALKYLREDDRRRSRALRDLAEVTLS